MTALKSLILEQIRASGPISVAEYMGLCLAHPEHGYYITRDPLGRGGDFTTAPEISQMFGEMIGLWLAEMWIRAGRPPRCILAELGPGRGTLMQDVIRAARAAPGFLETAEIWFMETSPTLRAEQAKRVPGARWADRIEDLPEAPLFLIANEFFDALPVRQLVKTPEGWREKQVGSDGDALVFGLGPVIAETPEAAPGAVLELCPAGESIAAEIGRRLEKQGGAALVIDYGYFAEEKIRALKNGTGDTLQALENHAYADALAHPGAADLTAHVDFDALVKAAQADSVNVWLTSQGEFLILSGIGHRAEALAQAAPHMRETLGAALHRLTGPAEMGRLFRVMGLVQNRALAQNRAEPPPGFPAEDGLNKEPRG